MGKRYNEKGEEIETRREVFMRNYKNVPGFKAAVKLGLYLIFVFAFLLLAIITNYGKREKETNQKATAIATTAKQLSFGDMLNDMSKVGRENKITIKYQDKEYLISTIIKENNIEGFYEDGTNNIKFVIKDNDVYEIKMNNETKNDDLLDFFDIDFINNLSLIEILKDTNSTKTLIEDGYEYSFDINKGDMDSYKLKAIAKDNKITNIEINNDIINYSIVVE